MKKNIVGGLVVAGMAAVTIGAFNLTNVSAAGVATTFDKIVRMYKPNGDLVTNRALGAHTPWQVGDTKTINGETMYQVSTSEYVKASDVSYDANPGGTDTNTNTDNSNVVITTVYSIGYNDEDGTTTSFHMNSDNPDLQGSYKVGRIVNNGIATYYQVAEHMWIDGSTGANSTSQDGTPWIQVTGDQNIEYDSNFSPVGDKVSGMTAQGIRDMLVDNFKCNADALAAIPDNWLLISYAVVMEQEEQRITGYINVINDTYPDVHGYGDGGFWIDRYNEA